MACCAVGARPDVADVDAALVGGGPENSFRKLAARFDVSVAALQRHKPHVPGAYQVGDTAPDTQAEPVDTSPAKSSELLNDTADTLAGMARPLVDVPNATSEPGPSPREMAKAEVENRVYSLRVRGKTWEEIGKQVGVHWGTAMDIAEAVVARKRNKVDRLADHHREIELRRCDALLDSVWDRATDPAMADVEVATEQGVKAYDLQDKAIDRVVKIMERRAKLLGLDVPTGPSVQVNVLSAPAAAPVVRALSQLVYALCPAEADTLDAFLADVDDDRDSAKSDPVGWLERRRGTITVEAG